MDTKSKLASVKKDCSTDTNFPKWKGPEEDGITFSLLSRFLVCRERFRLLVVGGLKPSDRWSHRLHYGQMWHVCEETVGKGAPKVNRWEQALFDYAKELAQRYPLQQGEVDHWYNVCLKQFPIYLNYWSKHPDVVERTVLLPETPFNVSYKLPSGRTVRLRGKWDSVDLIGNAIYLQENKTKGDINEQQLKRQLTFDLQTMLYLTALQESDLDLGIGVKNLGGVRYNVVRRPLSGGKGTIVRHKPSKKEPYGEKKEDFYKRVAAYIEEEPEHYFMRWRVEVNESDILRFRQQCLDPVLESLYDWWDWIQCGPAFRQDFDGNLSYPVPYALHWRHPFGVYNVLDEGGSSDLDEYLATGSELGLTRVDNLFPELTEKT